MFRGLGLKRSGGNRRLSSVSIEEGEGKSSAYERLLSKFRPNKNQKNVNDLQKKLAKQWPMSRFFGSPPTAYQGQVNSLPGALGPASSASWNNTFKLSGPAYSLGAQPLYYAPSKGFYVTSADTPAANGSVDFSNFGFGRKRRSRTRSRRHKKSRRSRRRSRRSRRSRKSSKRS